jgi:hypothetical protein
MEISKAEVARLWRIVSDLSREHPRRARVSSEESAREAREDLRVLTQVVHKLEAIAHLSWNRTVPFPQGVDFEAEALEKLRAQITPEMIRFIVEPAEAPAFEGDVGRPEIHRAILRVL